MDFIIHSTISDVERYLDDPTTPDRAMNILDLHNMFNECSRDACREELLKHDDLKTLIPYFDLLYDSDNTCWYVTADGFHFFNQAEGFAQGCPLSGLFAALTFLRVLLPINAELNQRRHPHELPTNSKSFHDDTSIFLRYRDILWFYKRFQVLGKPNGIQINFSKTNIFTTTSGISPLALLPPDQAQHLQEALDFLIAHGAPSPEITTGVRFLGFPLGNQSFAQQYLTKSISTYSTTLDKLSHRLSDRQTQSTLFRACAQSTIPHILAADVYHFATVDDTAHPKQAWSSPYLSAINNRSHAFLRGLTSHPDELPDYSIAIAYHPASMGGVGYRDHAVAAIPNFIISLGRSIQYAQHGIQIDGTTLKLLTSHSRSLTSWSNPRSQRQLFRLFSHYAPQTLVSDNNLSTLTTTLKTLSFQGLPSKLYRTFKRLQLDALLTDAPDHVSIALPSLLSPLTSLPLHSLPRNNADNRLNNNHFRTLLQRKLRLPVLPPHLHNQLCSCGQALDPYGDHFFSCRKHPKSTLSNACRDTIHTILATTAPLAGLCSSPYDVSIETPALLPTHPTKRPADVCITLSHSPQITVPSTFTRIAIDVTICKSPRHAPGLPAPLTPVNLPKAHHTSARAKFTGSNLNIISELNTEGIFLLPFTVDHLGGIGHFFHRFLYPPDSLLPDPEPPPWTTANDFTHHPAYIAYTAANKCPSRILQHANRQWFQTNGTTTRFGSTHHTASPQQWATQALALNLSYRLAQHINIAITKETDHKTTIKLQQIARSFRGKRFFPPKSPPLIPDSLPIDRLSLPPAPPLFS
jgi:hypothetical protein